MANLEVYRIGYKIAGQRPSETELDAENLCDLVRLFYDFLNENRGEKLESIDYIHCFRLPCSFPDTVSQEAMHEYGYAWNAMVPMGGEVAKRLFVEKSKTIYALHPNDTQSSIKTMEQLAEHAANGGLFGYPADLISIA